ncbi:MAG TPA: outer membrane beta-barrel protein [Vicinamibacterales bacterium]|nr:outer membrane beta-barrel protein [Vicinamibacterales bacterium]
MRVASPLAALLVLVLASGSASAQTAGRGNVWRHGTTVTGFAGIATDGSRSGPSIGGSIGWEVTPRVSLDGDGAWLEFGDGMSTFAASLKARARILGIRPVDPFIEAGVGFCRTSVAMTTRRPPAFYARRLSAGMMPGGPEMTFTDPTLAIGTGVHIFVSRRFSLRPALDATVVLRDRRHYVITTAALQAVFHLEDHPVTPSGRR